MNTSEQHSGRVVGDNVGVWVKRPVVYESHELARTYPQPLVPLKRVRVNLFAVTLNNQLTGHPEPAASSRWVFEHPTDLIEDVITRFNLGVLTDENQGHCSSPVVAGAGVSTPVDPALTIQEGAGTAPGADVAGACRCAAPADTSKGGSA